MFVQVIMANCARRDTTEAKPETEPEPEAEPEGKHEARPEPETNVSSITWWPEIKLKVAIDIGHFYNSCSLCLPKRKAHRAVGISVMAAERFKAVQMDFNILDGDIAAVSGIPDILTIICMATRMAMYISVKTITINTARTGGTHSLGCLQCSDQTVVQHLLPI